MKKTNRPLSPHLQIYKPQLTSMLSIVHRLTGFGLVIMACLIVLWLLSAASGSEALACFLNYAHYPLGRAIQALGIFAFFYHLFNGIRHLLWDMGWGLDLKRTYQSGWTVLILSIGSTLLYWIYL